MEAVDQSRVLDSHVGLSQAELWWRLGQDVADQRPATLYGRADVKAADVRRHKLRIIPTATPRNHANITDWPAEKSAQKRVAQEIAATATFVPSPAKPRARLSLEGA